MSVITRKYRVFYEITDNTKSLTYTAVRAVFLAVGRWRRRRLDNACLKHFLHLIINKVQVGNRMSSYGLLDGSRIPLT